MDTFASPPTAESVRGRPPHSDRLWIALVLGAVAFGIDVLTPHGLGDGFLYIIALFGALWARRQRSPLLVAGALTSLLVAGYLLSPPSAVPAAHSLINHALALVVLWAAAALLLRRTRDEAAERESTERLRASEARLRFVLEHSPDNVFIQDRQLRYVWVAGSPFGRRVEEYHGRTDLELFECRAEAEHCMALKQQVLAQGCGERAELSVTVGGERRHFEAWYEPFRDAGGQIGGVLGYVHDVSERKHAEQALRESERFVRRVLDNLFAFVGVLTPDGTLIEVNRAAVEAAGLGFAEVIGRKFWDCHWWSYSSEVQAQLKAAVGQALAGATVRYDVPVRMAGDARMWIDFQIAPLRDERGCITHLVPSAMDLTERKHAEQAQRVAVERYERQARLFEGVVSTTPDFVYLFDPQGRFCYANRRLLEVWGMELPQVIGKTCLELGYEPWHHDMHMREIAQVIETRRPIKGEVPFRAPRTGIYGVYEYIFTPVIGSDGEVELIAGTTRDVTERKRAEERLRESAEELEQLMNLAPAAIWVSHDAQCSEVRGNRTAVRFYEAGEVDNLSAGTGSRPEETVGPRRFFDVSGRELAPAELPMQRAAATNAEVHDVELMVRLPSGRSMTMLGSATPLRDAAGAVRGAIAAFIDISERKRAEAHRELLIRELAHRVKNTLAVVQSLATQTGISAGSIEEFRSSFGGRLAALAAAHDLLLRERWQPVMLRELLEQTLRPYLVEGSAVRVQLAGPPVRIEAQVAVSLSMALHELATNAAKYGSLSRAGGQVQLSWRVLEGAAIELAWSEHGGPPVRPPTRTGFGSRLIQSLSRELGEPIELAFEPAGLECRIKVPVASAPAASVALSA